MIRERLNRAASDQVRTLTPADVAAHMPRWNRGMDVQFIEASLALMPGRSVWIPRTEELLIVSPWRNRLDIGSINASAAVGNAEVLFRAATERARDAGDLAIVSIEWDVSRKAGFFERVEFETLQTIVSYELGAHVNVGQPTGTWQIRPFYPHDISVLPSLIDLDHKAFEWLWWNSEEEFLTYGLRPGVEILIIDIGDTVAGYVGFTDFGTWCHIDRIAVDPGLQGRGIGIELMRQAATRVRRAGRKRIELSTQSNNLRSRRFYERLGFEQKPNAEYRVYGRYLSNIAGDSPDRKPLKGT